MHPVFFLLDGFPPDQFSKPHLFALHILLMAARKIIPVNWMKVHQPTLTEWTQRLNQIYIFEKMTAEIAHFSTDLGINRNRSTWSLKCCREAFCSVFLFIYFLPLLVIICTFTYLFVYFSPLIFQVNVMCILLCF